DFSTVDGIRVRIAVHSGTAEAQNGDYLGGTLNRVARLLAIGHGGQVLISSAAAELLKEAASGGVALRDLGIHRLKDLSRPERIFQLVAPDLGDEFPALRSLELQDNLPQQLTSFVGRHAEVAEIRSLLKRHRLVTLLGAGGVGKTRCAIAACADPPEQFDDGIWFVELASISDSSLIPTAIAKALRMRDESGRPVLDALLEYLKGRRLLLIVDNCEHVIEEARRVVAAILRGGSSVSVLATSRENLNVAGERAVRLPPLTESDSVALFTERARAADSRFELSDGNAPFVADIAARLDGIPLAIELAAARVKMLSPQQIAQRLDERLRILTGGDRDGFSRHRTMRALIDWSHELLSDRERTLFRRLAVFAGGWTLAGAAAVCGDDDACDDLETLDTLSSLADKSLIVADPAGDDFRYRMLHAIREYARERLSEAGEAEATARRHARFYADYLQGCASLIDSLDDATWAQRTNAELDNIRAVVEWTLFAAHEPQTGCRAVAAIEWPQRLTTPHEALRWFEAAARSAPSVDDRLAVARILRHCAVLQRLVGRPIAECERTARSAVEAALAATDCNERALAFATLGAMYRDGARFDDAERAFARAYESPERLSRATTNVILRMWAVMNLQRGQIELARRRFSEVSRLERPGSEAHASALLNLGELNFAAGDLAAAREAAIAAKETYARLGSVYLVLVLSNIAAYAMAADDLTAARAALWEALHLPQTTRSLWMTTVLEHHALLAALQADLERAVRLAGFTNARSRSRGDAREHTERRGYERLVLILQSAYSSDDLASAMAEGAALTEEQALAIAAAIHEKQSDEASLKETQ
ncbi:MAG: hypothetical protein JO030_03560, partial [Candidatus Eremiobacteraeota bacterium]|nr:hypothetical protein [Candidatus Eremiobacteraeota bacterium]